MEALQQENEQLKKKLAELEGKVAETLSRPKIEQMSAEVVDSNPYRYGIHDDPPFLLFQDPTRSMCPLL